MLSVLPLHHTFEFSTGFLTPLSRGAQITYLPELTSEASRAGDQERPRDRHGRRAGALGVAASTHQEPALRTQQLVGKTADAMIKANAWLRDKTPFNLGPAAFLSDS